MVVVVVEVVVLLVVVLVLVVAVVVVVVVLLVVVGSSSGSCCATCSCGPCCTCTCRWNCSGCNRWRLANCRYHIRDKTLKFTSSCSIECISWWNPEISCQRKSVGCNGDSIDCVSCVTLQIRYSNLKLRNPLSVC